MEVDSRNDNPKWGCADCGREKFDRFWQEAGVKGWGLRKELWDSRQKLNNWVTAYTVSRWSRSTRLNPIKAYSISYLDKWVNWQYKFFPGTAKRHRTAKPDTFVVKATEVTPGGRWLYFMKSTKKTMNTITVRLPASWSIVQRDDICIKDNSLIHLDTNANVYIRYPGVFSASIAFLTDTLTDQGGINFA